MKRISSLLAGLFSIGATAGEVTDKVKEYCIGAKPTVVVARVENKEAEPINRVEAFGKLPFDFEYYGVAEEQGESDFYKSRLQWMPLKKGPLSLGVAAQHVNGNNFPEHNEVGVAARIQGKPTEGSFGKLDIRHFPDRETTDLYGFVSGKGVFADCLSAYNHETGTGFVNPGVDFNLGKGVSVGVEAKFSGEPDNLDKDYAGLRIKKVF
jgi:hypothetical protein